MLALQKPYSDKINMENQGNFGHNMNALETGVGIKTPVLTSLLDISIKPYTELNTEQELERYEVIMRNALNEVKKSNKANATIFSGNIDYFDEIMERVHYLMMEKVSPKSRLHYFNNFGERSNLIHQFGKQLSSEIRTLNVLSKNSGVTD